MYGNNVIVTIQTEEWNDVITYHNVTKIKTSVRELGTMHLESSYHEDYDIVDLDEIVNVEIEPTQILANNFSESQL